MKVCTACGIEYGDEVLFCQRDGTPLRPSGATADLVGQVIADRYHIQKKLGEGGMGQVYLAEHVKMGRRCAIKIMNQGLVNDADAISRFNREAANASRIGHTNVCAIYDFGETPEGLIYLAMEFIEGRSLNDLLEEAKVLPLARAAAIITQCADALQVAHDLGIVHRDLKPDNIMITTTGGKDVVKVVDFGIAKAVAGADSGSQKVTKTGFVVGTPEYMSPEQLAGDSIDGRSDLYSLALVFYRMLTGASPFPAETQQETMIKRLTDDPVPLNTARPEARFPDALQRVMDRALARTPTDRYPQSSEFARDVRGLSGTITGMVDIEAGTQVVRAEDLKGSPTVPHTRIDPARAKPKPAPATAADVAPRKNFPIIPAAVGVVLIAALGGAFAFKDSLFGKSGGNPPVSSDTTSKPPVTPVGSNPVVPESTTGTKPPVDPLSRPSENPGRRDTSRNGGRTNPNPITGRDTGTGRTNPPVATAVTSETLSGLLDEIYETKDRRNTARSKAERIYNDRTNPSDIRAGAANLVYLAHLQDATEACAAKQTEQWQTLAGQAKTWINNAANLNASKYESVATKAEGMTCQ